MGRLPGQYDEELGRRGGPQGPAPGPRRRPRPPRALRARGELYALPAPGSRRLYGFENDALADGTTATSWSSSWWRQGPRRAPERVLSPSTGRSPSRRRGGQGSGGARRRHRSAATSSPANVEVAQTEGGDPELGLTKAWSGKGAGATSSADLSQSRLRPRGTAAGMILGTAAYMSPGRPTASRWTSGGVWGSASSSISTGQRLSRAAVDDLLATILAREPDWQLSRRNAARLRRCCVAASSAIRSGAARRRGRPLTRRHRGRLDGEGDRRAGPGRGAALGRALVAGSCSAPSAAASRLSGWAVPAGAASSASLP